MLIRIKASVMIVTACVYAQIPTSIFINIMPGWYSLDPCAEQPLSTIVRDMLSGCGDNSGTTSFSCFCSASSTQFQSVISRAVAIQCHNDTREIAMANDVFSEYCQLGSSELRQMSESQNYILTLQRGLISHEKEMPFLRDGTTQTTGAVQSSASTETAEHLSTIIIAVVVPVVIVSIGAIIAYPYMKVMLRATRRSDGSQGHGESFHAGGHSSGALLRKQPIVWADELHNDHTCELPASTVTYELPSLVARHEIR